MIDFADFDQIKSKEKEMSGEKWVRRIQSENLVPMKNFKFPPKKVDKNECYMC